MRTWVKQMLARARVTLRKPLRRAKLGLQVELLESRQLFSVSTALLNSWFVSGQSEYTQVITANAGGTTSGPSTTWSGQSTPVLGDVQKIQYSTNGNYAYVYTPDLASYIMGPWWMDASHTQPFVNLPKNQNQIYRVAYNSTYPSTTHTTSAGGPVGIAVNGVVFYNAGDAFSYSHASASDVGMGGDTIWNRLAAFAEQATLDEGLGHQPGNGQYHYHEDAPALRAQLGDNIDYVGSTDYFPYDPAVYYLTHDEGADGTYVQHTTNLHHSPIIGWMFDGYPIYGPYGYANPTDATSAVTRMTSSFALRTDLTTGSPRISVPGWSAQVDAARLGATAAATAANAFYTMTATQQAQYAGPNVSATYPLGRYGEDYAYNPGSGTLDQFNGRWCVTPEFPNGTYAYFDTIDANGNSTFPYILNRQYYGTVSGSGRVTSITEAVTTAFDVSTNTAPVVKGPTTASAALSGTFSFTGSNAYSISDVDAAPAERITLTASAGTINVNLSGVLPSLATITAGANNSATITLSGDVTVLNAALATLVYSAPGSGSSATLSVQANDGSATSTLTTSITLIGNTIALSPTTLSDSTAGVLYSKAITASGGTGTTTMTVTNYSAGGSGLAAPTAGNATLTFNSTPSAGGSVSFDLQATDATGATTSRHYAFTINAAINFTTAVLLDWAVSKSGYSQSLATSGGTGTKSFALSGGSLPSGLSLASSGAITGTPISTGTFSFTVAATDSVGATGAKAYTVVVYQNLAVQFTAGTVYLGRDTSGNLVNYKWENGYVYVQSGQAWVAVHAADKVVLDSSTQVLFTQGTALYRATGVGSGYTFVKSGVRELLVGPVLGTTLSGAIIHDANGDIYTWSSAGLSLKTSGVRQVAISSFGGVQATMLFYSSGDLYLWVSASAASQLVGSNITSFALDALGNAYALTSSEVLYRNPAQGGGFVPIASSIYSFSIDSSNNVYALGTSGALSRATAGGSFTQFGAAVTSFAVDSSANVYALAADHVVYKAAAGGSFLPFGSNVTSFALDPSGIAYALTTGQTLYRAAAGGNFLPFGTAVTSFSLDASGNVYALNTSQTLYESTAQAAALLPVGNAVTSFAIDPSGSVFALTTNQYLYRSYFEGGGFQPYGYAVSSFTIDPIGNVYALTTYQALYKSSFQGGGFVPISSGVTAIGLDQANTVYALGTNHVLYQRTVSGTGFTTYATTVASLAQYDFGRIFYVMDDGSRWTWNGIVKVAAA